MVPSIATGGGIVGPRPRRRVSASRSSSAGRCSSRRRPRPHLPAGRRHRARADRVRARRRHPRSAVVGGTRGIHAGGHRGAARVSTAWRNIGPGVSAVGAGGRAAQCERRRRQWRRRRAHRRRQRRCRHSCSRDNGGAGASVSRRRTASWPDNRIAFNGTTACWSQRAAAQPSPAIDRASTSAPASCSTARRRATSTATSAR